MSNNPQYIDPFQDRVPEGFSVYGAILDLRVTTQRDAQGIDANTNSILMLNERIRKLEEIIRRLTDV